MDYTITHNEKNNTGGFYIIFDSKTLAKITYQRINDALIQVEHTEVDPSLAGRGIGQKLIHELVRWARESNTQINLLCPYAKAQFAKDPSLSDVLQ